VIAAESTKEAFMAKRKNLAPEFKDKVAFAALSGGIAPLLRINLYV